MKEYNVKITETLSATVVVEAESAARAREIAEREWQDGVHVLGAEHFQGVTFSTPNERTRER
ncbi:MAG: DpnD/PcfM family protein [Firmicutes bacterium]|nr:DpnD/PcfM family protein [Bacillota bacterium]